MAADLTHVDEHFEFGRNWESYSKLISNERIRLAELSLSKLVSSEQIKQKTFLDIGSGSGLFSVAASRLGAKKILAVDIDSFSVLTSRKTLSSFANSESEWNCIQKSVFDLNANEVGLWDVVYSWGVLHHTGDMYGAIRNASTLVNKNGILVLALYRKTKMCEYWKHAKRLYMNSPSVFQFLARSLYKFLNTLDLLRQGINPIRYFKNYKRERGMDWSHDVHDWLGGFPYESISPSEMKNFADSIGFTIVKEFVQPGGRGFWGSGNDEYVLKRVTI